jgi:hypothetical protein
MYRVASDCEPFGSLKHQEVFMLNLYKPPFSAVCAAVLLASAATGAQALTVTALTHGSGSAPVKEFVTLNALAVTPFIRDETNMGLHITASTEGSFYSVCVDIGQALLPLPNDYTHEANGTSLGFTTAKALRIAAVMQAAGFTSAHGFGGVNNTTKNFVALQMSVWNVVYDSDWSVTAGDFQQTSDTNGSARALANTWLSAASSITTPTYNVHKLYSANEQDLVFSVPEPSAYLMAMPVLGMLMLVARRRRQGK